jgi:hypothetical protein
MTHWKGLGNRRPPKTRLKILEDGRDKLVSLADALHAEIEEKTGEELIKLNEEILYNKGYIQNMAQTFMTTDNSDMLVRAQVALNEANKATNNSCIRIIGLRKKLEFLLTGSEAGSVTGGQHTPREADSRIGPSTRSRTETADQGADQGRRSRGGQPLEEARQPPEDRIQPPGGRAPTGHPSEVILISEPVKMERSI